MLSLIDLFIESRRSQGISTKTIYFYRQKLKRFQCFALKEGIKIGDISSDLIGQFLNSMRDDMSEDTRRGYWRAIRAFIRWAMEWDYLSDKTLKRFHPRFGQAASRIPLYDDDLERLFSAIPQNTLIGRRNHCLFTMMLCCGLRVSEAISIHLDAVDIAHGTVNVKGKGDKWRSVPIPPRLITSMARYVGAIPGPWLFPAMTHGRIQDRHIARGSVGRLFREYTEKAGIPDKKYCPHCMRHTYASKLFNNGVNLAYISKLMGHSSIGVTHDVYAHVFSDQATKAVNDTFR